MNRVKEWFTSRDLVFFFAGFIISLVILLLAGCAVAPTASSEEGLVTAETYYVDFGTDYNKFVYTWVRDGMRCVAIDDGLSCVALSELPLTEAN